MNLYPVPSKKTTIARIMISTYAERLKRALKDKHMTQKELAERIGVTQQTIGHLCSGRSTGSKHTPTIAAALGIDPVWLETGNDQRRTTTHSTAIPAPVPVIEWKNIHKHQNAPAISHRTCPTEHSASTYAVRYTGTMMQSETGQSFPDGCILFVDPEQTSRLTDKNPVIAAIGPGRDIAFKRYREEGGMQWVENINPKFNYGPTTDFVVIGRVIHAAIDV